jgi:hypothetical protein
VVASSSVPLGGHRGVAVLVGRGGGRVGHAVVDVAAAMLLVGQAGEVPLGGLVRQGGGGGAVEALGHELVAGQRGAHGPAHRVVADDPRVLVVGGVVDPAPHGRDSGDRAAQLAFGP